MVAPGARAATGGVDLAAAPTPPPPPRRKARLLSREELADIEYLFDRLSKEEAGAAGPGSMSPANSPLPLPILPAAPEARGGGGAGGGGGGGGGDAPSAVGGGSNNQAPPTVGLDQLKFALRAFGLPVREADVVALLERHGCVPGDGAEEEAARVAAAAAAAAADGSLRLTRPAFRELVGHALRDGLPGGRRDDMARAFALLDRGGKGRVTREDVAAAAAGALGREGAAALGGDGAIGDMLALFAAVGGRGGDRGVTLDEFSAGMSAVSLGRVPAAAAREAEE